MCVYRCLFQACISYSTSPFPSAQVRPEPSLWKARCISAHTPSASRSQARLCRPCPEDAERASGSSPAEPFRPAAVRTGFSPRSPSRSHFPTRRPAARAAHGTPRPGRRLGPNSVQPHNEPPCEQPAAPKAACRSPPADTAQRPARPYPLRPGRLPQGRSPPALPHGPGDWAARAPAEGGTAAAAPPPRGGARQAQPRPGPALPGAAFPARAEPCLRQDCRPERASAARQR